MLKRILSLAVAVNFICSAPICAQSSQQPDYTPQDIRLKLQEPKNIFKRNGLSAGLSDISLAMAAGYSLNANADILSKIKTFINDKTLARTNPPAALAQKSEQLTRTFNKAVKGQSNYAALSKDINLLNKQLQEFADYAASFPQKRGFSYIPPDLHPKIKQTLNSIPANLLKANPEMKSAVKSRRGISRVRKPRRNGTRICWGRIIIWR